MKKHLLIGAAAFFALGGMLTSCESDNDFDSTETIEIADAQFPYDSEGIWVDNDNKSYGNLNIDDYEFSHLFDEWGYVYGFTPSKVSDNSMKTPLSAYPYASAFGGGVKGPGSQYLVGYWGEYLEKKDTPQYEECPFNDRTCRIYAEDGDLFKPQSVMVCNTTWMKYAALNGTDFTAPFKAGDWVTLIAHGVHRDGSESEATYYLINIESENVEEGILQAWAQFDLRGLGECTGIYFTMDSSDTFKDPVYGLSVPTYFCLSNLVVKD